MEKVIRIMFLLLMAGLLYSCDFFRAGSYPFSEVYEMQCNDSILRENIHKMKDSILVYNVYSIDKNGNSYNIDTRTEFYDVFYFKIENGNVFQFAVHQSKQNPTKLLLIGYGKYTNTLCIKNINTNDFSMTENKYIKKLFENEILNKLGVDWSKNNILN